MYTIITFNPLIKYILTFIISYMYLNSIDTPINKIIPILAFIILLTIIMDIFMFDDFIEIVRSSYHVPPEEKN